MADGTVSAVEDITAGHKVALRDIPMGAPVRKYGEIIGVALADIPAGRHVHVHNLGIGRWEEPRASTSPTRTRPLGAAPTRDHFLGYRRVDGRAATRNYIVVVPTVNCSATVAGMIARRADDLHKGTPGLDGIIALPHDLGCGMGKGTLGDDILRRTLRGHLGHAKVAAALVISLGCEVNQPENLLAGDDAGVETLTRRMKPGVHSRGSTSLPELLRIRRLASHLDIPPWTIKIHCQGVHSKGSAS
ncbi:UxaA family hydrolase [Streptomyces sp. NPDC002076]